MAESLEPTEFRMACEALLDRWLQVQEDDEPIDAAFAKGFFITHYLGRPDCVEEATLRFMNVMDALDESPLNEFVVNREDGYEELYLIVFESAALAPLAEGKLDLEWIRRDLAERMRQAASFEKLLGQED